MKCSECHTKFTNSERICYAIGICKVALEHFKANADLFYSSMEIDQVNISPSISNKRTYTDFTELPTSSSSQPTVKKLKFSPKEQKYFHLSN